MGVGANPSINPFFTVSQLEFLQKLVRKNLKKGVENETVKVDGTVLC